MRFLVAAVVGLIACRDPSPPATRDRGPSQEAFDKVYRESVWGQNDAGAGHSGTGSTLSATKEYRAFVQKFLADHQIKSVVDAGCGDWEFSQAIDWTGIDYKGYDIVESVIASNKSRYGKPNIQFFVANVVDEALPPADLLISKHVLQHLPDAHVKRFLDTQLPRYKHALITNGVHANSKTANHAADIEIGGYRPLDIRQPPFNVSGKRALMYFDDHHYHLVVHVERAQ